MKTQEGEHLGKTCFTDAFIQILTSIYVSHTCNLTQVSPFHCVWAEPWKIYTSYSGEKDGKNILGQRTRMKPRYGDTKGVGKCNNSKSLESHIYHSSGKRGRDNKGKELKERKRKRGLEVREKKGKNS